jgi:hypothetical protein
MDVIEIINAWKNANNPTPKQEELAKLRFNICNDCPSKKILTRKLKIATICSECGCPISKKIFTPKFNACPLGKWGEVDIELTQQTQKQNSSLI